MGYVSNLFKFKEIRRLKEGFAIGYYRKDDNKALLKDGKIVDPFIEGVSNNMIRRADGESISLFLVKHYTGVCDVYNRSGNRLIQNIREAAEAGLVKKELTKFNGNDIEQYIVERDNGYALLIPQKDYVSDWYEFISEPNEFGVRKVTETDLNSSRKELKKMGRFTGRNISYYINDVGERISPEFVSEVDAGKYKIFWAPDDKEIMYDYIYKYDEESGSFVKQSYGYRVIEYVGGKFFAKDNSNLPFLIDETGRKISDHIMRYHVLDNGMVIGELANGRDVAEVYNNDYKKVCDLDYPTVSAKTGVVVGKPRGEKEFVMFGLNHDKKYPVNNNCAELIVKILGGSVPPKYYTASLIEDLTEDDIEKTIVAYEEIMKENMQLSPNNELCKVLSKTAREEFLKELREAIQFSVRKTRKELKDLDKEKLKKTKLIKGKLKSKNMVNKMLLGCESSESVLEEE